MYRKGSWHLFSLKRLSIVIDGVFSFAIICCVRLDGCLPFLALATKVLQSGRGRHRYIARPDDRIDAIGCFHRGINCRACSTVVGMMILTESGEEPEKLLCGEAGPANAPFGLVSLCVLELVVNPCRSRA